MIPLAMCQLNGKIDVKLSDFDEIREHPMSEPLKINIQNIIEEKYPDKGIENFKLSDAASIKIDRQRFDDAVKKLDASKDDRYSKPARISK